MTRCRRHRVVVVVSERDSCYHSSSRQQVRRRNSDPTIPSQSFLVDRRPLVCEALGLNNFQYYFGSSLSSLLYKIPQNPILIIEAPRLQPGRSWFGGLPLGPPRRKPYRTRHRPDLESIWEFPTIRGTLFWGPYNKDPII